VKVPDFFDDPDNYAPDGGPKSPAVVDDLGVNDWLERDEWAAVRSSNVAAIKYDLDRRELRVRFLRHAAGTEPQYLYQAVPVDVARGLFMADSVGTYLAARVKGHYGFVKEG
jgi:hypothetical protein